MELNLLKIGFTLMTLFIVVIGGLINNFEKNLPVFFAQTFRYGKYAYKGKPSNIIMLEVPKRWFRHFYLFAVNVSTISLGFGTYVYLFGGDVPQFLYGALDTLGTSYRRAGVSAVSAFLAIFLLNIQCWRRFYETFFVSVFSDSKMNIAHYAVGYIHYFGAIASILVEAPGFTTLSIDKTVDSTRTTQSTEQLKKPAA